MSGALKWKYYVGSCYFKETKKPPTGPVEGHWVLMLDEEYDLSEGLNYMGGLGYELVGIQTEQLPHGGDATRWNRPSYYYIFKKPL